MKVLIIIFLAIIQLILAVALFTQPFVNDKQLKRAVYEAAANPDNSVMQTNLLIARGEVREKTAKSKRIVLVLCVANLGLIFVCLRRRPQKATSTA